MNYTTQDNSDNIPLVRTQTPTWKWWQYAAVAGLVAFQLLVLILSSVALAKANSFSTAVSISECVQEFYPVLDSSDIKQGQVVSLVSSANGDSKVRLGAGTTITKHDKQIPLTFSPAQLEVIALNGSLVVSVFNDPTTKHIFLVEGTLSQQGDVNWSPFQDSGKLGTSLQAVTLSNSRLGLVASTGVYIADRFAPDSWTWSGPFSYSQVAEAINTQICSLSSTKFALSYYDTNPTNPYALTIRVGTFSLDNNVGSVHWSETLQYPNLTSPTSSIACPSSNSFVLSYYGNTFVTAMLVQISTDNGLNVTATDSVRGVTPTNFFASTALGPGTVIVAFDDASRDFAYTAAVLNVFSFGLIDFGGLVQLNAGAGGAELPNQLWSFVAITALSPNTFVFAYPDVGAGDRVVAVIGGVSKAAEIVLLSPSFVISPLNTRPSEEYLWVAAAGLDESSFVVVYALTADPVQQGIGSAAGRFLPSALGFAIDDAKNGEVKVAIAGRCDVPGVALMKGATYFGDAAGRFRAIPASSKTLVSIGYVDVGQEFLTQSSYIGHAVSTSELILEYKRS